MGDIVKANDMSIYANSGGPPRPDAPTSTPEAVTATEIASQNATSPAPQTTTPSATEPPAPQLPVDAAQNQTPGELTEPAPTDTPQDPPASPLSDPNSPYRKQFEMLVQANKEHRQRQQELKDLESDIQRREDVLRRIDQDPIAYIQEKYGDEAYQRHTDMVLGKPGERDPQHKLAKLIESQQDEIRALRELVEKGPAQKPAAPSGSYDYSQVATDYLRQASEVLAKPEYQDVAKWYSTDEIKQQIVTKADQILFQFRDLYGRDLQPEEVRDLLQNNLTAAQAVGSIASDLRSRRSRLNGTQTTEPQAAQPPTVQEAPQKPTPAPANQYGATLTKDLGKDVPVNDLTDADIMRMPHRKQIEVVLARHAARHSEG